ncbi:hypothetical protein A9P82_07865 [Arachidicoccus ginsenosidimutans]|nr:hypothetical protein A9P82_07865 [Arachidicoccus sp. BS20]
MKYILFLSLMNAMMSCNSCNNTNLSSINPSSDAIAVNDNDSVLTVVHWNIDWFGSAKNGVADKDLQQANVLKVIRFLNPDIIGFAEVVDTAGFRAMVDSLGNDKYSFKVSPYASSVSPLRSKYYTSAQKLAFIYKKGEFKIRFVRAYLSKSNRAGYNFSNGRYPYLLNADVTKNGVTKNISFFLIHAKSGADHTSYTRRKAAFEEFKDSLDKQYFYQKNMIILGDFNDELQGSITYGESVSPYRNFVQDEHYNCITLPLNKKGVASMIAEPSVVDQQIISSVFAKKYISHSAKIRTDVTTIIPGYERRQTSDHYPVSSQYVFRRQVN